MVVDIRELELEQDGYVRRLEQIEDEIAVLGNVLNSLESIQEIVCNQHIVSQKMFCDTAAWNGNCYSEFYEDYMGVYMGQYQNYINGIANTISDTQDAYDECQKVRDTLLESVQEITRKMKVLSGEFC